jgi:hypothetical protein
MGALGSLAVGAFLLINEILSDNDEQPRQKMLAGHRHYIHPPYLQCVHPLSLFVYMVHQMHLDACIVTTIRGRATPAFRLGRVLWRIFFCWWLSRQQSLFHGNGIYGFTSINATHDVTLTVTVRSRNVRMFTCLQFTVALQSLDRYSRPAVPN